MPLARMSEGSPEDQEKRTQQILDVLPEKPIVDSFIEEEIMVCMKPQLIKALKKEIEIYKKYPKTGKYEPKKFDPQNNQTCFMGQAFKWNGAGMEGWTDADLAVYRKKVGTIAHKEWGSCTLLEIWAADHFKDYQSMVTAVFKYCWGDRKTLPKLDFYINPLYRNIKSGKFKISDGQKWERENAEHMMKLAAYIEIRDRIKKSGVKNLTDLALNEKDDPVKRKRPNFDDEEDDKF